MSGGQTAVVFTMAALGGAMIILGVLARPGHIELALGGWSRETASPASWDAVHETIGTSFVVGGGLAVATAVAAAVAPDSWAGPVALSGSIILLVVVAVGVARGTNRLETRRANDL